MAASAENSLPGFAWLVIIGAITSAISLYYYLLVLKAAFVHSEHVQEKLSENSYPTLTILHHIAVIIPPTILIVTGFHPSLLLHPITQTLTAIVGL